MRLEALPPTALGPYPVARPDIGLRFLALPRYVGETSLVRHRAANPAVLTPVGNAATIGDGRLGPVMDVPDASGLQWSAIDANILSGLSSVSICIYCRLTTIESFGGWFGLGGTDARGVLHVFSGGSTWAMRTVTTNVNFGNASIADSLWHAHVITYDLSTVTHYMDGAQAGSAGSYSQPFGTTYTSVIRLGMADNISFVSMGQYAVFAVLDHDIGLAGAAAFAANPYRYLEPRRIFVPAPAAAGGAITGLLRNDVSAITKGHQSVRASQLGGVLVG